MTLKELEKVLYFESYVVIDPGDTPLQERRAADRDAATARRVEEYGPTAFHAGMGAEAIRELLKEHRHRQRSSSSCASR